MKVVIYTGAGISYDSGVPLFEDKDSVFSKYPLEIVAYKDGWKKNWPLFKSFMDELEKSFTCKEIKPNQTHYLLSQWEKENEDEFTIITTNIDDLHEQAGSKNVIHVHGNIKQKRKLPNGHNIPNCVLFGENKNFIYECNKIIKRSDVFVCVGSSLSTGDDNLLNLAIESGSKTFEINPVTTFYSNKFDFSIRKKGHDGLKEIYNMMKKFNKPTPKINSNHILQI